MRKASILGAVFILASCGHAQYSASMPPHDGRSQSAVRAAANIETTFYAFPRLQAGRIPNSPAIFDAHGDLFGSTYAGVTIVKQRSSRRSGRSRTIRFSWTPQQRLRHDGCGFIYKISQ